jgi:hypothetical protein
VVRLAVPPGRSPLFSTPSGFNPGESGVPYFPELLRRCNIARLSSENSENVLFERH